MVANMSKQETELKENQFLFNDEVVTVSNLKDGDWSFQNVGKETVQKLNPELFKEIEVEVKDFQARREQIIKEREEQEKQARIKKRQLTPDNKPTLQNVKVRMD